MSDSAETVLVTGGTGLLGAAVAASLAGASVISLSRHGRPGWQSASRRGRAASGLLPERNGHVIRGSDVPDNVTYLRGDLSEPSFAMSAAERARLAGRVDVIVHAAGVSDFTTPRAATEELNVESTRGFVEFAREARAPLYHLSTAYIDAEGTSVRGKWGAEVYIDSKRRAERIVGQSDDLAAIIRPSIVWGDAATGRSPSFQGLHKLIGMMLKNRMPLLPFGPQTCVDFLPRDVMGEVIGGLVRSRFRGLFWLTAGPAALPFGRVVELLGEYGRSIGVELTPPRFVESEMIERLIKPAGGETIARRVELLQALTSHLESQRLLPTSLAKSQLPDLEDALMRGAQYWGEHSGVSAPRRAEATI
jgi:thioester reductase-like protein